MRIATTLAALAATLCLSAAALADEATEARLKAEYDAAVKLLQDRSFAERWGTTKDFGSVERAKAVVSDAEVFERRLDSAMKDVKAYCATRFFVNACVDKERNRLYERKREIAQVRRAASTFLHDASLKDNVSAIPKRAPSEPIKMAPVKQKAPSEPVTFKPKTPKAPSMPTAIDGKTAPVPEDADARRAAEEANEAAYAKKQADAQKRREEADQASAKRRDERMKRRESVAETLEARRRAQEDYEAKRKNKESGLARYF